MSNDDLKFNIKKYKKKKIIKNWCKNTKLMAVKITFLRHQYKKKHSNKNIKQKPTGIIQIPVNPVEYESRLLRRSGIRDITCGNNLL